MKAVLSSQARSQCATLRFREDLRVSPARPLGHAGAFAECLTFPDRKLHVVPTEIPDKDAVFTELVAAAEILDQRRIAPGTSLAVMGDGELD